MSLNVKRDYKDEYKKFHKSKKSKLDRAGRNLIRRQEEKRLGKTALAGKDIHHKDGNPRNNVRSNLSIISKSKNRSIK